MLTFRQRVFVEQYLIEPNAIKAAITAGYSKKTAYRTGADNLRKPQIAVEIQKARAKRMAKAESDGVMVIRALENLAFSRLFLCH
jgi:phage terminase small subunit